MTVCHLKGNSRKFNYMKIAKESDWNIVENCQENVVFAFVLILHSTNSVDLFRVMFFFPKMPRIKYVRLCNNEIGN